MDMLKKLKKEVCEANLALAKHGLVVFTWGNVSAIDREKELVVIKPSGLTYKGMKPDDMTVVNLKGEIVEGSYRPSSDTPTHIELYKKFDQLGAIAHTHSVYATGWAQTGMKIPVLGTTHADYFYGDIPCTRSMSKEEIEGQYEKETGKVIVEAFKNINPMHIPAVIVHNHGPFTWGKNTFEAVHNSVVLEQIAKMAFITKSITSESKMNPYLTEKHFKRKHGKDSYYGQ